MRRLAVLALASVLATGGALGIGVPPAWAHICPKPVRIPVGKPSTIDVGVTVEDHAVPDVEIVVPSGLRLDRVDARTGWTLTRNGPNVRYRGGPIAAYMCEYFSLGVTAAGKGAFGVSVVQRDAGGAIVARSAPDPGNQGDRVLGQIVYAGVKPPSSGSSGPSSVTIAGIALVGLGVVMALVLWYRGRRDRRLADGDDVDDGDREAELQTRLEQFRKRTRDRPPE